MGNYNQTGTLQPQHNLNGPQIVPKDIDLKPITFQQFGEPSDEDKVNDIAKTSMFRKGNDTRLQIPLKSARKMDMQLNLQDISIHSPFDKSISNYDESNEVQMPFSVVKLSIDEDVMKTIKELNPDFIQEHQQEKRKKKHDSCWRVNARGLPCKRYLQDSIVVVKPGYVYDGGYIEREGQILPHQFGTLYSAKGMYVGSFDAGQAHGEGTYTDRRLKTAYKGKWINGEMIKGSISNDHFIFTGNFEKTIANGAGVIHYKKHHAIYRGQFKNGLYEDENAYFESTQYDYSGSFKEGKKDGIGCLIEKERFIKTRQKKYRPQQQYQGYFAQDIYVGKKRVPVN